MSVSMEVFQATCVKDDYSRYITGNVYCEVRRLDDVAHVNRYRGRDHGISMFRLHNEPASTEGVAWYICLECYNSLPDGARFVRVRPHRKPIARCMPE